MFGSDRQAAACARALLAPVRLADLWTPDGPTPRACGLYEADGGALSGGERALLLLAFALWNGGRRGAVADLLALDGGNLAAAGELLTAVALGPEAVDAWLDERAPPGEAA